MAGWFSALSKTRGLFRKVFAGDAGRGDDLDAATAEELLLRADLPPRLAFELADALDPVFRRTSRRALLRDRLIRELGEPTTFAWPIDPSPYVVMLLGVNGSGKTTTAAKLAQYAQTEGRRPMLCGSDTFRAAGSSQLGLWSERLKCAFTGGETGSDAAGVAFHAVERAVATGCSPVIVDTAGRMHTKGPLMDELPKMCRALDKRLPGAPHAVWMVLDASLGQNAAIQARRFHEVVPLTGLIVTKLDGSSKAGFLFALRSELNVPILFAGLGEGAEDLVPFDPAAFVDALLGENGEEDDAMEA